MRSFAPMWWTPDGIVDATTGRQLARRCTEPGCTEPLPPRAKAYCTECRRQQQKQQKARANARRTRARGIRNTPIRALPDIDPVAVMLACEGQPVTLNLAERRAAVARLTARGIPGREIAERIGSNLRSVTRDRAALRHQENAA